VIFQSLMSRGSVEKIFVILIETGKLVSCLRNLSKAQISGSSKKCMITLRITSKGSVEKIIVISIGTGKLVSGL